MFPSTESSQKEQNFCQETFQGCQTLGGRTSSDSWGDLQSSAPCWLHHIKSFSCVSDGWKTHPSLMCCTDLPGLQKNEWRYSWWQGVFRENVFWSLYWEYCNATYISGCLVQLQKVSSGADVEIFAVLISAAFCFTVREVLEEPLPCKIHVNVQGMRFDKKFLRNISGKLTLLWARRANHWLLALPLCPAFCHSD